MLKTDHVVRFGDARNLDFLENESIDLVVTSPPYPMIEMWDDLFQHLDPTIADQWEHGDGQALFELMHRQLDTVWAEVYRVLRNHGILCINVGDAVRSVGGVFSLFPNHARVLMACLELGFHALPMLLWRKPTNAPSKFMGSGMLPVGAYVTLEHEYILILRKGGLRRFDSSVMRANRAQSALFWEERNRWYSDVWDFRGTRQVLNGSEDRGRSAAFPFELAYRLINMYSVRSDLVLDPFLGTGTTLIAAMSACRNSVGLEIDSSFRSTIETGVRAAEANINNYLAQRLQAHLRFVEERGSTSFKYRNRYYGFPVMTLQERELLIPFVKNIELSRLEHMVVTYGEEAMTVSQVCGDAMRLRTDEEGKHE
jgi:DNA modification methylase